MPKRLRALLVCGVAAALVIWWGLQPHSFEDCVLAHVKPGLADNAVAAVYAACQAKFPEVAGDAATARPQDSTTAYDWDKFFEHLPVHADPGDHGATKSAALNPHSALWGRALALVLAPVMLLWAVFAKVAQIAGLRARWGWWLSSFCVTWLGSAAAVRVLGDSTETIAAAPLVLSAATLGLLAWVVKGAHATPLASGFAGSHDDTKPSAR